MARIEAQLPGYRELAIKILCWISHAARPLRVEELQHALAVEIGDQEFDDEGIEPENLLVSVCAGLVTVDDRSQTIRLVHYTVEEYFEKIKRNRFPNAQRDIARTLLTYLSFDVFGDKGCLSDKKSKDGVQQFALFDYATQYWAYHTADAQNDSVYKFAVDFLTHDFKAQNAGLALLARDRVVAAHNFLGIHLASYVGLKPLVSLLIAAGANPNSKDSLGRSPLSWAAMKGHVEVVKLLLAIPSIELDSKDMFDSTPIYLAAKYGHVEVVKEFLAIAKPMANDWDQGGEKQSSFSKDSRYDGVNDSLSTSAYHNPNSNSMYYSGEKPLSQAIRNGHFEIVKLLLGNEGIDRNRTSSLETPLLLAIKKGQPHIATMLLAAGADPNMGNRFLDTPLTCALDGGYMELVDTLLVAGARPNPEDFAFEGALNRAVRRQDVTVVKQACKGGITLLYKTSHRKSILHDTSTMEKSQ
jgi:ankyrin repeat protein